MALFKIGDTRISLKLVQNGKVYECVVKENITLTRNPNSPASITCSIRRDSITPEVGNAIKLTIDEQHHVFYGYIISTSKGYAWCDIEAYDQLYYMKRNKVRMSYENITASQLILRIIEDYKYDLVSETTLMDPGYVLPARVEENQTLLDIIQTAIDETKENTGMNYYLWDDAGNICFTTENWLAGEINLLVTLGYIQDRSYEQSLENYYTNARIEKNISSDTNKENGNSEKSVETYTASNGTESMYGTLEYFDTASDDENGQNLANQILDNQNGIPVTLNLSGVQGDVRVMGGTPILVDFFTWDNKEFIRGWFRTTSVTHTFGQGLHTMDVTLELIKMYDDWSKSLDEITHEKRDEQLGFNVRWGRIDWPPATS